MPACLRSESTLSYSTATCEARAHLLALRARHGQQLTTPKAGDCLAGFLAGALLTASCDKRSGGPCWSMCAPTLAWLTPRRAHAQGCRRCRCTRDAAVPARADAVARDTQRWPAREHATTRCPDPEMVVHIASACRGTPGVACPLFRRSAKTSKKVARGVIDRTKVGVRPSKVRAVDVLEIPPPRRAHV